MTRVTAFTSGLLAGLILAGLAGAFVVAPLGLMRRVPALDMVYGTIVLNATAHRQAPAQPLPSPVSKRPGSSPLLQADAGRNAYIGSCAECHGLQGDGRAALGQSMLPVATSLTSTDARQKSDGELAWIIKNGVSFTAMPGFAGQYADEDVSALVAYVRSLQAGRGRPVEVPTPGPSQLALARAGGSPPERGAAVYFSQGCQFCHGAFGDAPEDLAIQDVTTIPDAIRRGRPGMPVYDRGRISDAQLTDLVAYLQSGSS